MQVEQIDIPAFIGRTEAARARVAARKALATGKGPFERAYPELSPASLGVAAVLRGRLGLLDDAAVQRALDHSAGPPDVPPGVLSRWRKANDAMHAAEEQADALERGMLTAVLAGLRANPGLSSEAVRPLRATRVASRDAAAQAVQAATDDASRAAAQRQLALAEAELGRFDAVLASLRLVPAGGASPDMGPLLEQAADATDYTGVAGLLRVARPFVSGADTVKVDAALSAVASRARETALAEALQAREAADAPVVPAATVEEAQARLAAATGALDALVVRAGGFPPLTYPGDADREAAMALRLQAAELRLEIAEAVLEATTAVPEAAGEAVQVASQSEAEAAQLRAQQAKAEAADARERRVAEILSRYADASARSVELGAKATSATEALEEAKGSWSPTLASIQEQIQDIQQRSALDDRSTDADIQHTAVRELLSTLRVSEVVTGEALVRAQSYEAAHIEAIDADRARIVKGRELIPTLREETQQEVVDTLDRWESSLTDERLIGSRMLSNLQEARDIGLRTLHDARLARRALEPYISREQQVKDRANLLQDIRQEVSLLPSSVWMMARDRWSSLTELSGKYSDYNVLRGLVRGSVWTIVLVLGWWWARGQVNHWALMAAQRVRRWRPELRMSDVAALKEPTVRLLRNAVDLALGYSLIWSLDGGLKEITFVLLVYLQFSQYRVILAAFDLLAITTDEVRPALLVLRKDIYTLARTTVRWFTGYWIVSAFIRFLCWDVLGLDTITNLVEWFLGWGWWILIGWALWRWQPYLRERTAPHAEGHKVVAWLARDDNSLVFRIPRAIGCLVFFVARSGVDLLYRGARDGSNLSWLLNLVSRYRLDDDASEEIRVLSEEMRLAIVNAVTDDKHLIHREELQSTTASALAEWRRTQRRGLMAIVGDRGSGKSTATEQVEELVKAKGMEVTTLDLTERLTAETELIRWLCAQLELPPCESLDKVAEAIELLPSQCIILRGVHRAFERRVGGMAAITGLLYVLNTTSDRHFWAISLHGPAWDYFDSMGSLVDTGVFRVVVRLAPLSSSQLRALTAARLGSLGLRIDFSGLVRASAFGADPEVELERSTAMFYRLLAEASTGNPTIAMHMFARCVVPTDDEHVVTVRMGSVLSGGVIDALSEAALFVLVALRLQDQLTLEEIVEVTNLSLPLVRATVRDLLSRNLLERGDNDMLQVPDEALQSVTRTLRRRHFLHLGAA